MEVTTKTGVWKITPLVNKTIKIEEIRYKIYNNTMYYYNVYGWLFTRTDGQLEVFVEEKPTISIADAAKWIAHRNERELRKITFDGEVFPLLFQQEIAWKQFTSRYSLTEHPNFMGLIVDGIWDDSCCGTGEWPLPKPYGAEVVNRNELFELWLKGQVQ